MNYKNKDIEIQKYKNIYNVENAPKCTRLTVSLPTILLGLAARRAALA